MRLQYTPNEITRFWSKVSKDDTCWLWVSTTTRGYGRMSVGGSGGRMVRAHRMSYELAHGAIPEGMNVCHRCDNPRCVNPSHLFLGTQHDNMRDMVAKGRATKGCGEHVGTAKLTATEVVSIRSLAAQGATFAEIGRRYSVSKTMVRLIVRRQFWQHI